MAPRGEQLPADREEGETTRELRHRLIRSSKSSDYNRIESDYCDNHPLVLLRA